MSHSTTPVQYVVRPPARSTLWASRWQSSPRRYKTTSRLASDVDRLERTPRSSAPVPLSRVTVGAHRPDRPPAIHPAASSRNLHNALAASAAAGSRPWLRHTEFPHPARPRGPHVLDARRGRESGLVHVCRWVAVAHSATYS